MRLPCLNLAELNSKAPRVLAAWRQGVFIVSLRGVFADCHSSDGHAPYLAVRSLFDRHDAVRANPESYERKDRRFWRGLVSPEGQEQLGARGAVRDKKRTIDLTSSAIASSRLLKRLGTDFSQIRLFFEAYEQQVVPALARSISLNLAVDVDAIGSHHMYRMLDYPEIPSDYLEDKGDHGDSDSHRKDQLLQPRCHAHQDFGTFTLLWMDSPGLEVARGDGCNAWNPVPTYVLESHPSVVVIAGCALTAVTHGETCAPAHRVVNFGTTALSRRSSIALFVEPAKSQYLPMPHSWLQGENPLEMQITYGEMKNKLRLAGQMG